VAELVRHGVPRLQAAESVAALVADPALIVARRKLAAGQRLNLVRRLLTLQAAHAAKPEDIERRTTPGSDELFDRYYATSTPVVFVDLVTRWPAFGKWSPEHFRDRYGDVTVHVTDDRCRDPQYDMNTERHTRPTRMAEFAERVLSAGETNDFYMVARNKNIARPELATLFEDVVLPEGWFVEEHRLSSSALWFGPAGTVTPLHHDSSCILFCQVYGRKRWRIASPLELRLLDGATQMYSAFDPESPAAAQALAGVTFKDFTLAPGEALFIPAGWFHHVRALDVSISLAMNHLARPNDFDSWYRPGDVR
jgi:hypothetical protein